MTPPTENAPGFDPEAVREKYQQERAKRMTESRGIIHDLKGDHRLAKYTSDPHTPFIDREPVADRRRRRHHRRRDVGCGDGGQAARRRPAAGSC